MSGEVFRLQRIIEISKTYLQAESHRIHFKQIEIPSINNWISDFVIESNLSMQCQFLRADQRLKTDPFWLKFILSNLVQNAFAHGKEPVCIRLENRKSNLRITVEDQGSCDFQSLDQMTTAFVKSSRSKGMGLGLNIAKFIVEEWGSEIEFSNSPTSFTLSLGSSGVRMG
jgi:signal transduction histidine kinase